MDEQHSHFESEAVQPPMLLLAIFIEAVALIFGRAKRSPAIHWRETWVEAAARFLVGLMAGGALCVVLFPVLFWPTRRSRVSLYEAFGQPSGVGWVFVFVFLGSPLIAALTTRGIFRGVSAIPLVLLSESDADEKTKTGCMGVLLPLAVAAFGIYRLTHPRRLNRFTGLPNKIQDGLSEGEFALGLALIVHAFGFVPYSRVPLLKYIVAAAGVAIIVFGFKDSHG